MECHAVCIFLPGTRKLPSIQTCEFPPICALLTSHIESSFPEHSRDFDWQTTTSRRARKKPTLELNVLFSLRRRSSENKEISGDVGGNSRSESGFSIEDSLAKRFQMAAAEAAKQTCSSSENEMEKPHEKFLKQIICGEYSIQRCWSVQLIFVLCVLHGAEEQGK